MPGETHEYINYVTAWYDLTNNTVIVYPEVDSPSAQLCPACDGEGSRMYQWAKEAMLKCGGSRRPLSGGRRGCYYVNAEGQEMEMKPIGGRCSVCGGSGWVMPGGGHALPG